MKKNFLKSESIRVLVNGIHAKSGGGVTYLRNILPLLAEDSELEIHLFIHRDQFDLFGMMDERIRLHLLNFESRFFSNLIWEQFAIPFLAKIMSVDVTVSPANYGPLFAPAQIIMLRNSLAVAEKEKRPIKRLYWAGLTVMTALSLFSCRRAIAVSEYARNALTFGLGKRFQRKVRVVHHGVGDGFRPSKFTNRGDYLLAVSDIYVQKNLHTLVSALELIREEFPDIILKIAGRAVDVGYLKELDEVIAQKKLAEAVEFLGDCGSDELQDLYQSCKLFVFPSTVETFGNPLVEAMACGAPIVSSNTAAMPEVLGDAGKYFDPLDVKDIAEQIILLLNSDVTREEMGDKSLERSKSFSRRQTANNTAEIIKSIVPGRISVNSLDKIQTQS